MEYKMKYAIVDIGSNSIRLTVYETENENFKILLKQKIIAGLASYVKNGMLTKKGIDCAANSLLEFKETIDAFAIKNVSVFATASLRNIANTDEAVNLISAAAGYHIEVISGEEEALLGYIGATYHHSDKSAAVIDIGGASTEVAVLTEEGTHNAVSYPIGSLKLYGECVKKILPGEGAVERIQEKIEKTITNKERLDFPKKDSIICVGGTARGVFKIARHLLGISPDTSMMTKEEFDKVCEYLLKCNKKSYALILKTEPERIHTMIPGLLILKYLVDRFGAKRISVSNYGVREGYLCKNILLERKGSINIRKTEN